MIKDAEGFFMPAVNTNLCIDCGLCYKKCIIGKKTEEIRLDELVDTVSYYCFAKDDNIRKRSASGGIGFLISDHIINQGGVVFGVVGKWFENVHHTMATTQEELIPICNSKNIQSNIGGTFKEAKQILDEGKKVLFTGTPCQIAALYSFLEKKYENLTTCDLICHGVPSQLVLKEYIKVLEQNSKKKVVSFGRENTNQYLPVQYIVRYDDGSNEILMPETSNYRKGFLSNLFQRKSCYTCSYSRLPRVGDITLGDAMFFNKEKTKEIDPLNLGISLITINTEIGEKELKDIDDRIEKHIIPLELAINGNEWLSKTIPSNSLRKAFYKRFMRAGFEKSEQIICKSYNRWKRGGRKYYKNLIKTLLSPKELFKKIKKRVFGIK